MYIKSIKTNIAACLLLMFSAVTTATAANTWKISDQEVKAGTQATIQLQLENTDEVVSFQMDITLPDGVLLAATPSLSADRTDGHVFDWSNKSNNTYRCVVYSTTNKAIKGSEGTLLSIPVQFVKGFSSGQIKLSQIVMADKKSQSLTSSTEIGTFTAEKELKKIVLNISGLEQVVNEQKAAVITLATFPVSLSPECTITYYKDQQLQATADEEARKKAGIFYVKITRAADDTYLAVSETYMMSVNDKKEVTLTAPASVTLTAGLPLSAAVLTGGSAKNKKEETIPVPGSFVWTNGGTIVTESGDYSATFIPADNLTYNSQTIGVHVEVLPTCFISVIDPTAGGRIQAKGKNDKDVYIKGQTLELAAIPDADYEFTGWTGISDNSKSKTVSVKADGKDLTISANFERKMYTVSFSQPANGGKIVVKDENGVSISSGDSRPHGTVLSISAEPEEGMKVDELKVNNVSFTTGKYKLEAAISSIAATFSKIPDSAYKLIVEGLTHGSVRLYKTDGSMIPSGSSLPVDTKFTVVVLPENGYAAGAPVVKSNNNVISPTEGVFTVTGNISISATFTEKTYVVKASVTGSGKLELSQTGKCRYGTPVTIKEAKESSSRLVRIVANGKEVRVGETLTVTSDLTVTALFEKRVDIKPEYIIQTPQRYVYNGISRDFIAYATQTYAFYSFDVKYKKEGKGSELNNAVDAGNYDVIVSRNADELYNAFNHTYDKRLIIDKSRILVTEAPTSESEDGKTRPSTGVKVTKETNGQLIKFTYSPDDATVKNNYESTVYYLSTNTSTVALNFNASILRNTSSDEVKGYVRVTNGNLPYTAEQLKTIPEGTIVTAEAVPANGYKFVRWSDDKTDNPREITVGSENMNFTPVFDGKAELKNITLNPSSAEYNGQVQEVNLSGLPTGIEGCIVSFYSDEDCTQSVEMKNSGTYWIRIYRPEDEQYKELNTKLSYTITQASVGTLVSPVASDVVIGESLNQSELSGGNAGVVPGVFQWENATTKVDKESNSFNAKFIPSDPNYKETTVAVSVKGIPATKSTGTDPDPEEPVIPDNPGDEETPDTTVEAPVITTREAETAVISWTKVEQAVSYKLNLYTDKNKATLLQSLDFDKDGNLRSATISFRLTGLKADQKYYIETIAYNKEGKEIAKKGIDLPSAVTTSIEAIKENVLLTVDNKTLHIGLSTQADITVFNISGEQVFRKDKVNGSIDVTLDQSGLYVVVFRTNENRYARKVLVK
ncbi:InlB B-repeat-containing protein [Parabacteroides timonensis]|uniref:InlB B-repeat-containing protein n=1 Tax=Parabacteroides timonensis TaxID=1871013 RepID=UPI00094E98E7|nr:T9SS type A sorting domain-containing protein [Parabacteroides timonensis]